MKPATLLRLALAGSGTDTLRVVFTAVSSALAALTLLSAATVIAIPELGGPDSGSDGWNSQYRSSLLAEPGLRPGVVATLLLAAVPIVALAGQCVRFGSPGRDRRLAAIRLAGATPRQAVLIAAGETAMAATVGSIAGLGVYLVLHRVLHRPHADGRLPLPTDVLPSAPVVVGILLVVPVLAGLAAVLLLRKVIITPFGVVRRARGRKPSVLPGVLIIAGVFAPLMIRPFGEWLLRQNVVRGSTAFLIGATLMVVAAIAGVVLGTGWIAHTAGRVLRRYARRPGALLAGRQLMADPWSGSRTFASLLAAVIIGAGVYAYRSYLLTMFAATAQANALAGEGGDSSYDTGFYLGAIDLINVAVGIGAVIAAIGILVAVAEGIVSRRRAYAALVAQGVPRRTLGEALVWRAFAPLVPAVLIALSVGVGLIRTPLPAVSVTPRRCGGEPTQCVQLPELTLAVPVPFRDLALIGGGALVLMTLVVGAALLVLRTSTDLEELRTG